MATADRSADGPFTARLPVRFGDVDPAGIVYYPRLLHFCHVAMEEFFAAVARIDYPTLVRDHRLGFPAVRVESDFRAPFRYGETAEIAVAVERLGGSSATWAYALSAAGEAEPRVRARVVTVCLDMAAYEKRPIPDWLRHRLRGEASELPPPASTG